MIQYTGFQNIISKKCHSRIISWCLVALVLACSSFRIADTYKKITPSCDEVQHIATGLEWIQNGTYYLEALHPPLSRIFIALLPSVYGYKISRELYQEYANPFFTINGYLKSGYGRVLAGENFLFDNSYEEYEKKITLSRLGILPFFILCGIAIFLWSLKLYKNEVIAVLSVLIYSTLPIVLAYSGTAMTDVPAAATFTLAVYISIIWLEQKQPVLKLTILLGFILGLMVLSKFSNILFFLFSAAAALISKDWITKLPSKGYSIKWIMHLLLSATIFFLTIWAGYRFSVTELSFPFFIKDDGWEQIIQIFEYFHFDSDNVSKLKELRILPFPEFLKGLAEVFFRNHLEYAGYIFGEMLIYKGVWYFFPVSLFLKTPIPFIIFSVLGVFYTFNLAKKNKDWVLLIPLTSCFAILMVAILTFNINIGVRHVLHVFPLLSMVSAYAIYRLFLKEDLYKKLLCGILCIWYIISTFICHPCYLSYFNFAAGDDPYNILIDNDFDSGQEIKILADELRRSGIMDKTRVYYQESLSDITFFGFKEAFFRYKKPYSKFFGLQLDPNFHFGDKEYIAISIAFKALLAPDKFGEISSCQAEKRIGDTFVLYKKSDCLAMLN